MSRTGKHRSLRTRLEAAFQRAPGVEAPHIAQWQELAPGLVLCSYRWPLAHGLCNIHVCEVDLEAGHLALEQVFSAKGINSRHSLAALAQEARPLVLFSGNFFSARRHNAPLGIVLQGGRLFISPHDNPAWQALAITGGGQAQITSFAFQGQVQAPSGLSWPLLGINRVAAKEQDGVAGFRLYGEQWRGLLRGAFRNGQATVGYQELLLDGAQRLLAVAEAGTFPFAIPSGHMILAGQGGAGEILAAQARPGDRLTITTGIRPVGDYQTIIGGHGLLLQDGLRLPYEPDNIDTVGHRARVALGLSADGSHAYLLYAEGAGPTSKGLTLFELAGVLLDIGAWDGINLDGGASAGLLYATETGYQQLGQGEAGRLQRRVPSGVGVFVRPHNALA